MEEILLARAKSKINAALFTSERIDANHPEELCHTDLKDWYKIADQCITTAELHEEFETWLERASAWEIKDKGMLN